MGHGTMERRQAMAYLRGCLTEQEFERVSRLTREGRHLPFGPDGEAALERLLLVAEDEDLELLIKCQSALETLASPPGAADAFGAGDPFVPARDLAGTAADDLAALEGVLAPPRPSPRDRLHFRFEVDSRVLMPFLASLRRNGFRTVTVESAAEVDVFVALAGGTDLEVVRQMDLVQSLLEIVRETVTRTVRGRRLTP